MTQLSLIDGDTGLQVLVKTPSTSREFRMDFGNLLRGDSIASVASVVVTTVGDVVGSAAVSASAGTPEGRYVTFALSGGTHRERYKILVSVTTAAGHTLQGAGMLYVRSL